MTKVQVDQKDAMTKSFESSSKFTAPSSGSFISHESPAQSFMFDLTATDLTDLATDFNEFNDFYKNDNEYRKIERPQNPFYKNFQSYQADKVTQRNSFSNTDLGSLLQEAQAEEPLALKKQTSLDEIVGI